MVEFRAGPAGVRPRVRGGDPAAVHRRRSAAAVLVSPDMAFEGLQWAVIDRRPARLRRLMALLLLATLAVASCSGDDGVESGSTTSTEASSTTSSSTTTTVDPAEEALDEIEEAYDASGRAFIEAAAIPDPNHESFVATHTGPMLQQRRTVLRGLQADGRLIRYPPDSEYRVEIDPGSVEIEGDIATFKICGVDDGERVVAATGEVVAGGTVTVQAQVAMQRVDGTWKLAERRQLAEWEGVAGCATE